MGVTLERLRRDWTVLSRQLEETTEVHQDDRARMEKELAELRQLGAQRATEAERLQAECEARVLSMETRHRTELERERLGVASVLRENEKLRSSLSTQRHQASSGMDSLQ